MKQLFTPNWLQVKFWAVIIIFISVFWIGVWSIYDCGYENGRAEVAEINLKADAWESRAKELDAYIIEKEKQFRAANRWSHFFEMMCSEDNEIKFDFLKTKLDGLDGYVKDGKERFKVKK